MKHGICEYLECDKCYIMYLCVGEAEFLNVLQPSSIKSKKWLLIIISLWFSASCAKLSCNNQQAGLRVSKICLYIAIFIYIDELFSKNANAV